MSIAKASNRKQGKGKENTLAILLRGRTFSSQAYLRLYPIHFVFFQSHFVHNKHRLSAVNWRISAQNDIDFQFGCGAIGRSMAHGPHIFLTFESHRAIELSLFSLLVLRCESRIKRRRYPLRTRIFALQISTLHSNERHV